MYDHLMTTPLTSDLVVRLIRVNPSTGARLLNKVEYFDNPKSALSFVERYDYFNIQMKDNTYDVYYSD